MWGFAISRKNNNVEFFISRFLRGVFDRDGLAGATVVAPLDPRSGGRRPDGLLPAGPPSVVIGVVPVPEHTIRVFAIPATGRKNGASPVPVAAAAVVVKAENHLRAVDGLDCGTGRRGGVFPHNS